MKSEKLNNCIKNVYHFHKMFNKEIDLLREMAEQDGFRMSNKLTFNQLLRIHNNIIDIKSRSRLILESMQDITRFIPPSRSLFDKEK